MNRTRTTIALLSACAVLLTGGLVLSQSADTPPATTQPETTAAAPTTQPDSTPPAAPTVTAAGPASDSTGTAVTEPQELPTSATPAESPAAAPTEPGGGQPGPTGPAEQGTPPPIPSADEMMQSLISGDGGRGQTPLTPSGGQDVLPPEPGERAREPTSPGRPSPVAEPVAPGATAKLLPEGYMLVDRLGVLKRDQGRWIFALKADESARTEPPLVLLPNSLLEAMQEQGDYGRRSMQFRVTGEVTQYQQSNYLLLRKVLIEHNMDRF